MCSQSIRIELDHLDWLISGTKIQSSLGSLPRPGKEEGVKVNFSGHYVLRHWEALSQRQFGTG